MIALSQLYIEAAIVENNNVNTGVARRIPVPEVAITGAPTYAFTGTSLVRCMKLCMRYSCSAFNFGRGICELHETFLCADVRALEARPGVSYYDVEVGDFAKVMFC
ncbi:hypothetical protein DPMN_144459 [Dreissena polymorpha]|uniref:Apple domain-containing protein n=1 Tax=Dreissena polymorpha TaxID=45954 RepID=A0A9D4GFG7_DREPO|nr:hypothetical protein DPMN_144459 [Dreissena polymorpha]